MTDYISTMYHKFRAMSSNVSLVETGDPQRNLEVLNFYLQRGLRPWNFDSCEKKVYEVIKGLIKKEEKATQSKVINWILSDKENKIHKLKVEDILDIIQKLKTGQYIVTESPETYTTGKPLQYTQIIHFDAWAGLRVNHMRPKPRDENSEIDLETAKIVEESSWEEYRLESDADEEKDELLAAIQSNQQETDRINLETALDIIDKEIKTTRTIAILTGIIPNHGGGESLRRLAEAVNSWAHDIKIYNEESFVNIMTSTRNILPQSSLENVIFLRPPVSTQKEREMIVNILSFRYNLAPNRKILIKNLAGLNLHQCQTILLESFCYTRDFKLSFISSAKKEQVEKHGILRILKPDYGFERIGGYESIKRFIREGIINVLQNPELAETLNLKPLRGVLLFGIWGSGKSLLAKALAYETKLPLFNLQPGALRSKFVGETERITANTIDTVEANKPCIVLIEEADNLGHRSDSDADSGTSRRVFGQLLDYMGDENRQAIIFGTTNSPEYLDKAFLREGRLTPIPQLLPNFDARMAIFPVQLYKKWLVKTRFIEGPDDPFALFAEKTAGATGAEIEGIINEAQRTAFRENRSYITEEDILRAIEIYNIDIDERLKTQKRYIEIAERICRNKQLLHEIRNEHALIQRTRRG